jgi:solute:Na+ symporter, SSS family
MVDPGIGLLLTAAALVAFAWVGVQAAARFGVGDRDPYLTARSSQPATPIALSFFASALGAWILFAPPEVGTFGGFLGIAGYAVGQAAAVAVFAALGPRIRALMPQGTTILEFVRERFGRVLQAYVGAVAVVYMFVFLTAELTAIGGVLASLAGVGPAIPILAVSAATPADNANGGGGAYTKMTVPTTE